MLMKSLNMLQRNGYAFSAKAVTHFVVNSRVFFAFASMSKSSYSPIIQFSTELSIQTRNAEKIKKRDCASDVSVGSQ
jgi:hypothetical protein